MFMGPAWDPPGSCRPQMGPMLAPWTLLSGYLTYSIFHNYVHCNDTHSFIWDVIIHPCPNVNCGWDVQFMAINKYFLSKVNIWNVKYVRATAFIFDTRTGVLVKVSKFLRQKCLHLRGMLVSISLLVPSGQSPVPKTSSRHVFKTSKTLIQKTSIRPKLDVLGTSP